MRVGGCRQVKRVYEAAPAEGGLSLLPLLG